MKRSAPPAGAFWQSGQYFRLLIDNARDYAIFSMDPEGRITNWNCGAERLLDWSEEEALGQSSAMIFTEEDRAAEVPAKEMARAAAEGETEDTRWHVRKDGTPFWANGVMIAVRDEVGAFIGFAKILRDLTAQKRYEELLEEKNAALERVNRALKRSNLRLEAFASETAHELRSPLMGMRLVLRSLSRNYAEVLDEETVTMARETQESIRDLDLFASELLSYARLGGNGALDRDRFDSRSALDEALSDLAALIKARSTEIQVGPLPTVWANHTLLRHLFRNLVGNAIEHNDTDVSRVWISADDWKDGDAWLFCIEDNGPGLPEERRARIVSLFHESDIGESAGIGVGLTLSKRIVDHHGGRIWVESESGQGCTFFFTLPKHPES